MLCGGITGQPSGPLSRLGQLRNRNYQHHARVGRLDSQVHQQSQEEISWRFFLQPLLSLGIMDTMKATQYSLKNPYTGDELVRCDASELTSFLSYFRGLIGVWEIPYEVL
jgi:hypothetical protein